MRAVLFSVKNFNVPANVTHGFEVFEGTWFCLACDLGAANDVQNLSNYFTMSILGGCTAQCKSTDPRIICFNEVLGRSSEILPYIDTTS